MKQITLTELPEPVQNLINQAQQTGEQLTIIQNGVVWEQKSFTQDKKVVH